MIKLIIILISSIICSEIIFNYSSDLDLINEIESIEKEEIVYFYQLIKILLLGLEILLLLKQISSSGDKILDEYAKETIEKSFPFEAFPEEEMLRSYFAINFPIKFKGIKNGSDIN